MEGANVIELFLAGAHVVLDALSDDRVVAAWDQPSVLADQKVSGLAGHLARGGVWAAADYLDGEPPAGPPDFVSPAGYFAQISDQLTEELHESIRSRGAEVAAVGQAALVALLSERLAVLETRLRTESPDRLIAVIWGKVMRLDHFLITRLIEQIVHLDDLARSVDHPGWPQNPDAEALVVATGADIGRLRHGPTAMVRALYRDGFTDRTLPVLS